MKTILLLTDFSPNSTAAAESALLLAQSMRLDLVLFNSYIKHQELPSAIGAGWDVEDFLVRHHHSKVNMQALTEGLEALSRRNPDAYQPIIHHIINDDELGMSVEELCRRYPVAMVIMGAMIHEGNIYVHEMNINTVVDIAKRPVWVIPGNTNLLQYRKIIFATAFHEADVEALHWLTKIGRFLHYQIEVIHIKKSDEHDDEIRRSQFIDQLMKIDYTGLTYKTAYADNIPVRLKHLCEKEDALLALTHHHLSLFAKIFENSVTKKETADQDQPIIVLPSQLSAYEHH
ncbi:MAG: hypothetical protein ACTHNW_08645 [Mucilaginibacter sp.]